MTKVEILKLQKKVASKMMAAIAMLLVASVMMVGVTYAWISISSAPEASNISTTVGANGALEIALQSSMPGATNRRAEIKSGRGDSVATKNATEANKTWGNIIDLTSGYGLEAITLYPSRINVNKLSSSVNTSEYLSIPAFGADGRITGLDSTSFLTYNGSGSGASFTEGRVYGVNILGTASDDAVESETVTYHYRRSLIRDEAAGYLEQYRTSLRDQLVKMLETNQVGICNLLLRASQLLNSNGQITGNTWTSENVATVRTIITKMISLTRESEVSLKWALLAQAVADDTTYPPNDETAMAALGNLYKNFLTYPLTASGSNTSIRSIADANGYDELVDAVDSIIRSENQLAQALVYISDNDTITNACILVIDIQNTFLKNGSEIETDGHGTGNPATGTPHRLYEEFDTTVNQNFRKGIYYNYIKKIYYDYLYFTANPTGITTGLFSIMANVLGDYQATIAAYFNTTNYTFTDDPGNGRKLYTMYVRGSGKDSVSLFSVRNNRGVLGSVYDDIMSYDPGNAMIEFSVNKMNGTAYGYSVDFAFRANEDCDLLLKKEATDRVTGISEESDGFDASSPTAGSGSNESFTLSGDLIGANSDSAKELMQSIYIVLTATDTGRILGIVSADNPQVVLEQGTASLAIYEPQISDEGILTKGDKRASNVITSLNENETVYITAIVFLNGDTFSSGAVSSTQHPSLYGTINLQFASSKTLVPASLIE